MTDLHSPPAREPGPQPDPMLEPGRRSRGWVWFVALAIVVIVGGTLYALNPPAQQTTTNDSAPPQTNGASQAPQTPISGGRTTGAAPAEQVPTKGENSGGNAQTGK